MILNRILLLGLLCTSLNSLAAEPAAVEDRLDQWHGFTRRKFVVDGREAWIIIRTGWRILRQW